MIATNNDKFFIYLIELNDLRRRYKSIEEENEFIDNSLNTLVERIKNCESPELVHILRHNLSVEEGGLSRPRETGSLEVNKIIEGQYSKDVDFDNVIFNVMKIVNAVRESNHEALELRLLSLEDYETGKYNNSLYLKIIHHEYDPYDNNSEIYDYINILEKGQLTDTEFLIVFLFSANIIQGLVK